jgi:DedD protein
MDRRVKERLVGATILVVLVVLIVPELLSGPKRAVEAPQASPPGATEPIRTVIVDLATSKATATDDAAAPAATEGAATAGEPGDPAYGEGAGMPHTDPAPAAPVGQAEQPPSPQPPPPPQTPQPPQPAATPQPAPPPLEAGSSSPNPAHHGWQAQLGSFAARANAEKLERQLRAEGFSPSMSAAGAGSAARYRVRVGPVADRAAAERLVAQLKKAGHTATFVAP